MNVGEIKVIVVDDDLLFGDMVSKGLIAMGYDVIHYTSLIGINGIIDDFNPSVILLDVEIGDKNGIDESLSIRGRHSTLPIIFISANPLDEYIQKAITTTGAMFLKKPCSITEISTFINKFAINDNNIISIGTCELFIDTKTLRDNLTGDTFNLKTREFEVLLLLAKNKNVIVDNSQILQQIGRKKSPSSNQVICNIISCIRKYLKTNNFASIINHKSRGYLLKIE